jgi:hypothetical protein
LILDQFKLCCRSGRQGSWMGWLFTQIAGAVVRWFSGHHYRDGAPSMGLYAG